jgi:hypothetical protein
MGRNEEVKNKDPPKVSIMNVVERTKSPNSKFLLRSIGLALLALSVIAAPVVLPTVVVSVADIGCCWRCAFCSESNDS